MFIARQEMVSAAGSTGPALAPEMGSRSVEAPASFRPATPAWALGMCDRTVSSRTPNGASRNATGGVATGLFLCYMASGQDRSFPGETKKRPMRLRDIQRIIDEANLPARPDFSRDSGLSIDHPLGVRLDGCSALKRALHILAQAPAFEGVVRPMLTNKAFMAQYGDSVVGPRRDLDPLISQLIELINAVALLRKVLQHALPNESPSTLAIQIPEPRSLEALEALVAELGRFFDILAKIEDADDGERVDMRPAVQAFDSGSFYIEVVFSTVAALSIVGVITKAAYNALAVWENYKQAQARIALTSLAVQEVASVAQHNNALRAALMESAVAEVKKSRFPKVRGEGEAALRAAIQQKTELLEKHIVFLPPATSPKEVLSSFPAPSDIKHVLSGEPQKLIKATNQETPSSRALGDKTDP